MPRCSSLASAELGFVVEETAVLLSLCRPVPLLIGVSLAISAGDSSCLTIGSVGVGDVGTGVSTMDGSTDNGVGGWLWLNPVRPPFSGRQASV